MAAALVEQPQGKRVVVFWANYAVAGGLMVTSSTVAAVIASIDSFWGCVAQLSAPGWLGKFSSGTNAADTPSRNRPLPRKPRVTEGVASHLMGSRPRRILSGPGNSLTTFS